MDSDLVQSPRRSISLVRHEDDLGLVKRGSLIPLGLVKRAPGVVATPPRAALLVVGKSLVALMLLVSLGTQLFWLVETQGPQLAAAIGASTSPTLLIANQYSGRLEPPRFGAMPTLEERAHYETVREQLISGGATFIDLDLTADRLMFFNKGVLELTQTVIRKPSVTSWCYAAAGLYEVAEVLPYHTSTYIEAQLPSSVVFGPNLFIHGVPEAVDGTPLSGDFDRDCIRLARSDAAALAEKVTPGAVVLVHEVAPPVPVETFTYESKVPQFSTPYYLIADLKSETILAVGKKHTAVPIASLTKLMTALIVLEHLPLDERVAVEEPNLIESLIPRLHDRSKVSVHTLLELLLVESSNEAAEVLAAALGREEFIALMNERAQKLGLIDTVFTDPSGIDAGNVSSVNDLWWLTRYIYLHHPMLFSITENKPRTTNPYVDDGFTGLSNFNDLESVNSFIGGKVGETEAARQTSVTLHRIVVSGVARDIAVVLLGSEGRRDDVIKLLTYIEERFKD